MIEVGTKIKDEADGSIWKIVEINGDMAEVISVTPENRSDKQKFLMEFQTGTVKISDIKPEDIIV